MGKKRKTLREKKLAEFRHQKTPHKENTSGLTEKKATEPITPTLTYTFKTTEKQTVTHAYSLKHDLVKTLSVSGVIILFQLLLFILLHNHALVLPLVSLRY